MKPRNGVAVALVVGWACLAGATPRPPAVDSKARRLINAYLEASTALVDSTYVVKKTERMRNDEVVERVLQVKLRRRPYAVYIKRLAPDPGMEAIFRAGANDDQVREHSGSFPDFTFNLAPEGSHMMGEAHHPIYAVGPTGVDRRLHDALALVPTGSVRIRSDNTRLVAGVMAPCIDIFAPHVTSRTVMARHGETLFDLARRTNSWPYLLYMHNPQVDALGTHLTAGSRVVVPGYYAVRSELCFNPASHLVVKESYWDADGLYERYVVKDRRINVGLIDRDFDPHNPAYNF